MLGSWTFDACDHVEVLDLVRSADAEFLVQPVRSPYLAKAVFYIDGMTGTG